MRLFKKVRASAPPPERSGRSRPRCPRFGSRSGDFSLAVLRLSGGWPLRRTPSGGSRIHGKTACGPVFRGVLVRQEIPAGQRERRGVKFRSFWGRDDGLPCRTAGRAPNRISAVLGESRWASLPDSGKGTKSNFGCFGGEPMGFPAGQREGYQVEFRLFWGRADGIPCRTAGKARGQISVVLGEDLCDSPPGGAKRPAQAVFPDADSAATRFPTGRADVSGAPRAGRTGTAKGRPAGRPFARKELRQNLISSAGNRLQRSLCKPPRTDRRGRSS